MSEKPKKSTESKETKVSESLHSPDQKAVSGGLHETKQDHPIKKDGLHESQHIEDDDDDDDDVLDYGSSVPNQTSGGNPTGERAHPNLTSGGNPASVGLFDSIKLVTPVEDAAATHDDTPKKKKVATKK